MIVLTGMGPAMIETEEGLVLSAQRGKMRALKVLVLVVGLRRGAETIGAEATCGLDQRALFVRGLEHPCPPSRRVVA